MNGFQRVIKYCAIALAIVLAIGIISLVVKITLGIVTITTGGAMISKYANNEEFDTVDVTDTFDYVKSLDIDHSTGELIIRTGDTFKVEAINVFPNDFEAEVKGDGRLVISDGKAGFRFFGIHFNGISSPRSKITVYLPEDFIAEEALIDSGAGTVTVEGLQTDYLYISAGAGNIRCEDIIADKAKIEGGVGGMTLSDVELNNASFDNGVGNLNITGILTGDSSLDCGVGAVRLDLTGEVDDYDLKVDTGVGAVRVNGVKVGEDSGRNPSAENSIRIDGGVGEVRINIESNFQK